MNPSLFIILPRGVIITKPDVERESDSKDYGEIKQVSIQTTKLGDRNAVVHFERWFRSCDDIIDRLSSGFINIKTRDFGYWRATVYVVKSPNVTLRKPRKQTNPKKYEKPEQKRRPRSPVMTDEAEIPAVILEFIETCRVSEKPVPQQYVEVVVEEQAPCLSDPAPQVLSLRHPDDMELEEGEIFAL